MNINWNSVGVTCRDVVEKARIVPILQQILVITAIYDGVMAIHYCNQWKFENSMHQWDNEKAKVQRAYNRANIAWAIKSRTIQNRGNLNSTNNPKYRDEIQKMPDGSFCTISKEEIENSSQETVGRLQKALHNCTVNEEEAKQAEKQHQAKIDYHMQHLYNAFKCFLPWGTYHAYQWNWGNEAGKKIRPIWPVPTEA